MKGVASAKGSITSCYTNPSLIGKQVTHDSPRPATSRHQSPSSLGSSIAVVGPLNDTMLLPTTWAKLHLPDESILEIHCLLNTGATRSTILDSVQTGQPDATNTIFGYVISGAFSK